MILFRSMSNTYSGLTQKVFAIIPESVFDFSPEQVFDLLRNDCSIWSGIHSGVGFISYTEPYLSTTGIFRDAIISILATLARQEKVRIQERVKAGLVRAKAQGKKLGRKGLTPIQRRNILELHREGLSMSKIAKKLKLSKGVVHKTLSERRDGKLDMDGFRMGSNLWS